MLDPALTPLLPFAVRLWAPLLGSVVALLAVLVGVYVVRAHPITVREPSAQRALEVSALRGALGLPLLVVTGAAVVTALAVRPPFVDAWAAGICSGVGMTLGWWVARAHAERAVDPSLTLMGALWTEVAAIVSSPWIAAFAVATLLAPLSQRSTVLLLLPLLVWYGVAWIRHLALRRKLEVSERATTATRRAEALTGLRASRVFHLPARRGANAFAWPVSSTVVFYGSILDDLDDDELTAIAAHELGHLRHRRAALVVSLVGSLSALPLVFLRNVAMASGWLGILGGLLCPALVGVFVARHSHRWEIEADRVAREAGLDEPLGRALARLGVLNDVPPNTSGTHRPVHLRVSSADTLRLDLRPSPAAPRLTAFFGLLVVCVVQALFGLGVVPRSDVARACVTLAERRVREGNVASVVALVEQARDVSGNDPVISARGATLLASAGRCWEARWLLSRAQSEIAHLNLWPKEFEIAGAELEDRCK